MNLFGVGPVELVIILLVAAAVFVPVWRILTRMGFSFEKRILLLLGLLLLPGFGLCILLWVIALSPWPSLEQPARDCLPATGPHA